MPTITGFQSGNVSFLQQLLSAVPGNSLSIPIGSYISHQNALGYDFAITGLLVDDADLGASTNFYDFNGQELIPNGNGGLDVIDVHAYIGRYFYMYPLNNDDVLCDGMLVKGLAGRVNSVVFGWWVAEENVELIETDGPGGNDWYVNSGSQPGSNNTLYPYSTWSGIDWDLNAFYDAVAVFRSGNDSLLMNLLNQNSFNVTVQGSDVAQVSFSGFAQGDRLTGSNAREYLYGNGGNDVLIGWGGNDVLFGGEGHDSLFGGLGNDALYGGTGNDSLNAGGGNNYLNGGLGDDWYFLGAGADRIDDNGGYDQLFLENASRIDWVFNVFNGDSLGDSFESETFEQFNGSGGNDHFIMPLARASAVNLQGNGGDDVLAGAQGADTIDGGAGNDVLRGNRGNDNLAGGSGTDTAFFDDVTVGNGWIINTGSAFLGIPAGVATRELSAGVSETDQLISIENIWASNLHDEIYGGLEDNQFYGLDGNDTLDGNGGNNLLDGGAGNDTYNLGLGQNTVIDSSGSDHIYYLTESDVILNFQLGTRGGAALYDVIDDLAIEGFFGGSGADTFVMRSNRASAVYLDGGWGNDILVGGSGNDTLTGGDSDGPNAALDGINHLTGGRGNDVLVGGAGADTAWFDDHFGSTGWYINLSSGIASTTFFFLGNTFTETDTMLFIEHAYGSLGNDTMIGSAVANNLWGNDGSDTLYGGLGADYLHGGAGIDTVSFRLATAGVTASLASGRGSTGEAAGDTYVEFENLEGSNFNDTLIAGATGARLYGGGGADSLYGGGQADFFFGGAGADYMSGLSGNDRAFYTSSSSAVQINLLTNVNTGGEAQGDTLLAIEEIYGSNFGDTIIGNTLNNVLGGNGGADRLDGGVGADVLIGGAGSDTFVFNLGHSGQAVTTMDRISDYAKGAVGTGDEIDADVNLIIGGSAAAATTTQALINQSTGVASFAAGSGTTLIDALLDVSARMTAATNTAGEIAFFQVNNTGPFHMFISDGVAGVTGNDLLVQLTGITSIGTINITAGDLTILT